MYTQLQQRDSSRPPVSIATLGRMKSEGEKIAAITCYDASFAAVADAGGADVVLVGDSLGMVIQGHDTTVPVTLDHVIYHSRAVAKGLFRPFLMADMPFMTYTSREQALQNAVRLMQEGGAKMVKLEGGAGQIEIVEFLTSHDIAVCAHLGLKPQSVHKTGGFRVQGREQAVADRMKRDALALAAGGGRHRAARVHTECARRGDHRRARGASDRHRRRPGRGRPDPRALRHSRHHAGSQAEVRQELHGGSRQPARRHRQLRRGGQGPQLPGAGALFLTPRAGTDMRTMQTHTRIADMRAQVHGWRMAGETIAFVPTMGNLHAGHASLIAAAHHHGRRVVASVFVNPLQFGPNEDYTTYPRTPQEDTALLSAQGVDALLLPTVEEMYPLGTPASTVVEVPEISDILCGAFRPGHFRGVATVVVKLLNLVQPDVAIFGEKDYQQLTIIRRAVEDLCLPVRVVGAPTVRAEDGLALSSRNRYLDDAERAVAPELYRALDAARRRLVSGELDLNAIEGQGLASLQAAGFRPDYFEVRTAGTLAKPQGRDVDLVVLGAARLRRARLIDNVQCRAPGPF